MTGIHGQREAVKNCIASGQIFRADGTKLDTLPLGRKQIKKLKSRKSKTSIPPRKLFRTGKPLAKRGISFRSKVRQFIYMSVCLSVSQVSRIFQGMPHGPILYLLSNSLKAKNSSRIPQKQSINFFKTFYLLMQIQWFHT